jgi:hypothetical protein
MTDTPWNTRPVLELDLSAAAVYVEKPERAPRLGGRWLVFEDAVWWELPDGAGYRKSLYSVDSFPGHDFVEMSTS